MRRLLFLIFIYTMSLNIMAGSPADSTTTEVVDQSGGGSLYVGTGYGSDLLYTGYSFSGQKPYYSMDMLYSINRQWSVSAAIYNMDGADPAIAFYDMAVGYRRYFNSWLDAGASVSAYFTSSAIKDLYFGNFAYLTLTGGLDWRILYTRFVYSAVLDDSGTDYLQVKNSHYFSTNDFWKDRAYMDFNPTFNFVLGDRYSLTTITDTGLPLSGGGTEEIIGYENSFGLIDLEISFPIAFNYDDFSIEAEPLYYIPIHKDPDYPSTKGLFFFLNLYLRIF
jgi:hypothetical protein